MVKFIMVHIPIWMLSNYPRRLKGVFTKRYIPLWSDRYRVPCASHETIYSPPGYQPGHGRGKKKRMGRHSLLCAGRRNRNPWSKRSGPCIKISHLKRERRKKQKKPLAFFLGSCYYLIVVMTDRGIAQLIEQRSPKP